jgi:hypothetical protein
METEAFDAGARPRPLTALEAHCAAEAFRLALDSDVEFSVATLNLHNRVSRPAVDKNVNRCAADPQVCNSDRAEKLRQNRSYERKPRSGRVDFDSE